MKYISEYVPPSSIEYCQKLISLHEFKLIFTKERQTKLGDFRRDKNNNFTITVNRNLNAYQFLITFIHEYAHLIVAVRYPKSVKAHGKEWKLTFKELILPMLNPEVFPDNILRPLAKHMRNPKAAASSDPILWKALQQHNLVDDHLTLVDIPDNEKFVFRKRSFTRLKKRRTRVLCQEVSSGKQYLIPEIAQVSRLD